MLTRDTGAAGETAERRGVVIAFPARAPRDNRLSVRDRVTLLDWEHRHGPSGVGRVLIEQWETGDDPAVVGDFAMIYLRDKEWASWSLARSATRFQVWETGYGRTLGVFTTLAGALACLEELLLLVKPSSTPRRHGAARRASSRRAGRTGANRSAAEPAERSRAGA